MLDLQSEATRRNPYPEYERIRRQCPVMRDPRSGHWMIFDFDGVKQTLNSPDQFSSKYGPDWLIFLDPPRHTKLRALISRAFTPRSVAELEPRIEELARTMLRSALERGRMDVATDFSVPLPILVIAQMLGIPAVDHAQIRRWSDVILTMSYTISAPGSPDSEKALEDFSTATVEMNAYLNGLIARGRAEATDDLLSRLLEAEVDGERLKQEEILGFFQLLILAGTETTTNLINNAVLCFLEFPEQLALLRSTPGLLSSAIEEVLRFRAPLQWMYRVAKKDVSLRGQTIRTGSLVLAMIGSANRDPQQFPDPDCFTIARAPNWHLAFGLGAHFCLGAPLARLEARVALSQFLQMIGNFELASFEPWKPRRGVNVLGPTHLPIRFEPV
jgi:cytochrome P450